jgi:uncharacterized protein YdhG (YjbR/CyaY superfamily)
MKKANRFQPVAFTHVRNFLAYLPPEELEMVELLRTIVLEGIPDCKEKLAYNVPFYYRYSRICFIWPGSVPWGKIKEGVEMGFCKGNLLSDSSYLNAGDRKEVYIKTFQHVKEIDATLLRALLYEAVQIDLALHQTKKKIYVKGF